MKQFLKFLLASCLGVIAATFLLFGIGGLIIAGIVNQTDQPQKVKPNTVLHLTFNNPIPEQTNNLELDPFNFQQEKILGLTATIDAIERAAGDDNIKGIFLEVDGLPSGGLANISVLRTALEKFKASDKFIIAYSKYYSQGAYYLSTTADELHLNPLGMVDFRGFAAQVPFFKEMLEKIGVDMQIFYAGKFKGATEPYRLYELSEENKLQIRTYLTDIYDNFLDDISKGRRLTENELRQFANEYTGLDPEEALASGLVDKVSYRDEALASIRTRIGLEEDEKIPTISLEAYNRSNPQEKDYSIKDKIAVIYAEGTIIDGKGEPGTIGDEEYTEYVRKARQDDKVKAIVLRVNSPGGSAMSSENIWREIKLAREEGKPVVVSMGDYAASGGYYISCGADSIFAEPNTLTGSIGVFMMIPDLSELMGDKIGIEFDTVKTGNFSTGINGLYPLSTAEGRLLQERTDDLYETFLKRVSDGRGLSRDEVHAIAQGRVWTGERAATIGLVDDLGGLDRALASAATLAGLEEYRTTEYPKVKDQFQQLMEQWMGEASFKAAVLSKTNLGPYYERVEFLNEIREGAGIQARLPFLISFE